MNYHRVIWWTLLILSACVLVGCTMSPAQAAGVGAAGVAAFDAMLQSLVQSGQIDPSTATAMSQSVHNVADGAVKTADGLQQLWDSFRDFKSKTVETFSSAREMFMQEIAKANDAATTKAAVATLAGGGVGTSAVQVIRGPREATRQKMRAKA